LWPSGLLVSLPHDFLPSPTLSINLGADPQIKRARWMTTPRPGSREMTFLYGVLSLRESRKSHFFWNDVPRLLEERLSSWFTPPLARLIGRISTPPPFPTFLFSWKVWIGSLLLTIIDTSFARERTPLPSGGVRKLQPSITFFL